MLRPMIPLAVGVAVLGTHTRLTRLETDTPVLAAFGTAKDVDLVHPTRQRVRQSSGGVKKE